MHETLSGHLVTNVEQLGDARFPITQCKDKNWVQIAFMTANNNDIVGLLHLHYQNTVPVSEAKSEIFDSKVQIENEIHQEVNTFAISF